MGVVRCGDRKGTRMPGYDTTLMTLLGGGDGWWGTGRAGVDGCDSCNGDRGWVISWKNLRNSFLTVSGEYDILQCR